MSVLGKRVSDQGTEHATSANSSSTSKRARLSATANGAIANGRAEDAASDEDDDAADDNEPQQDELLSQLTAALASSRGGQIVGDLAVDRGAQEEVGRKLAALTRANNMPGHVDEEQERIDRETYEREDAEAHGLSELKAGAIEKVELINFMCHDHFSIELGPRLNIIIGQNGSGKSAILTAMTIALGAKASSTSRASNLRTLVKHGRSQATVRIVLSNQGDEAFKPHLYGSRITIERRIKADGPATWKLLDEAGKTVETTSAELHAICDQFNLQMDNPINVLTQDNARQFLGTHDPKKLYSVYWEGTQLSTLDKERNVVKANLAKMRALLDQQLRARDRLKENLKEAERQWERVQAARGYQAKIELLKNELAWTFVSESEERLRDAEKREAKCRADRDKLQANCSSTQAALDKFGEQINQADVEMETRADKKRELQAQVDALKPKMSAKRSELEDEKNKEQELVRQRKQLRGEIEEIQTRIDIEAEKLAEAGQQRRRALEEKQSEVNSKMEQLQDELEERRREVQKLEEQRNQIVKQQSVAETDRSELRRKADVLDAHIRTLEASRTNSLAAFGGEAVPQLVNAIERDQGWVRKPIGPLGRHLKLKEMKWAEVLESVIGNTLNAFFVTCHEDRRRLEGYIRQYRVKSMVLKGSDELFDFSSGEPDPEITTILRVLDIDNEIVKRQLITSVRIERSALVPTRSDGDRLMRQQPRNVHNCFSSDIYQIKGGQQGSASIALNKHTGAPRFSQSNKQVLEDTRRERKAIETELVQADQRLRQLQANRANLERDINALKRQTMPQLQRQIQQYKQEFQGIADDLKDDEPANIRALEESKDELEKAAAASVEQFRAVQDRKDALQRELDRLEEERAQLRRQHEKIKESDDKTQEHIMKLTENRVKLKTNLQYFEGKVAKAEDRLKEAAEERELMETDLAETKEMASSSGEEIEVARTSEEIQREIDATKTLQERSNRESGVSLEQAQQELVTAKEKRDKGEEQYALMNSLQAVLESANQKRSYKIEEFKRSTASRTKHLFTKHLQKRGYSGSLHFNHSGKLLTIEANKDGKGHNNDPKSLSGGERSYTTTCLLLSLWQAIKSPIRCLDEFDVFMDVVNRKIALELLMGETMAYKNVQYVLITPLELPGNVNVDRDGVMVHKLAEPERGHNTLM